ncbi:hypothetical protein [Draconibacterium orientale]|uniref:hypothetical protein n=1 Tax=Draconibacterium orientale TaxID=1168034 RepID=UPI002ABDB587|nr:hypothetical protein [Draconibacterium orientale]
MTKIKSVVFSRFRNYDHYQFITEFRTRINKATPATLNIENKMPGFNTAYAELDTVYKKNDSSDFTPLINGADVKRDRYWVLFLCVCALQLWAPTRQKLRLPKS